MQYADELKTQAVLSAEIGRKGGGARLAVQADRGWVPLGVGNSAWRQLPVRHFAGGKDGQHSALLQPLDGFLQSAPVALLRARRAQWIDKKATLLQFRNTLEQ